MYGLVDHLLILRTVQLCMLCLVTPCCYHGRWQLLVLQQQRSFILIVDETLGVEGHTTVSWLQTTATFCEAQTLVFGYTKRGSRSQPSGELVFDYLHGSDHVDVSIG